MNKNLIVLFSIIIGSASSIAPPVLLNYGIGQFNIIQVVGQEQATWWFSLTSGIASISLIFLKPFFGYIFDKTSLITLSRPFWILIGSLMGFFSIIYLSHAENMVSLIIFWIISSLSYGLVSLIYFVFIPELFNKNNFGVISGLIGSLIPVIVMIISITAMGVLSFLSIESKTIFIASIQLIFNIIVVFLIRIPLKNSSSQNKENTNIYKDYIYPSFKKHPNFTWTFLSRICVHIVTSGLSMMTLYYISRFAMHEEEIFKLHSITSVGVLFMVISGMFFGYVSDKIKKRKVFIIISSSAISFCMIMYSNADSVLFVIIISFIYQFFFGMFNSVDLALVNQVLPSKENHAKDIAIMNATNHISQSLISFITPILLAWGAAWMNDDGYTLFFMVLAFFSFLSVLFISQVNEI